MKWKNCFKTFQEDRGTWVLSLLFQATESGKIITKPSAVIQGFEEISNETGLTCCICREGYKYHPNKVSLVSAHTFSRVLLDSSLNATSSLGSWHLHVHKALHLGWFWSGTTQKPGGWCISNIVNNTRSGSVTGITKLLMESTFLIKHSSIKGYSTVSHFNIVHYECHVAAIRWVIHRK